MLRTLFNIKPNEEKLVILFFLQSIFIGFPKLFTLTVASALFLESYSANIIPYVYLLACALIPVVGGIQLFFEKHTSLLKLQRLSLVFLCVTTIIFIILLNFSPGSALPKLFLLAWVEIEWTLLGLFYWSICNRVFTVEQGKRLFALLGSGEILTFNIGGLFMPIIVKIFDTKNLLFLSLIGMICSLITLFYIDKIFKSKLSQSDPEFKVKTIPLQLKSSYKLSFKKNNIFKIFKTRYQLLICIFLALSGYTVYFFVDNIFYFYVNQHFENYNQRAVFMGQFLGFFGFVNLFMRIFVTGRWMARFGIFGSLITPASVLILFVGVFLITNSFSNDSIILFRLIILIKLLERALASSIGYPAYYILYQPLPPELRSKLQTTIEVVVCPFWGLFVSLILLSLNQYFSVSSIALAILLLIVLTIWASFVFPLNKYYKKALEKALEKHKIFSEDFYDEYDTIQIIEKKINRCEPEEIIYYLKLLEDIAYEQIDVFLLKFTQHQSPIVRQNVYKIIEGQNNEIYFHCLRKQLKYETNTQAKTALIKALAASDGVQAYDLITPYLQSESTALYQGTLIALIQYCGIEGAVKAGHLLIQLEHSERADVRKFAAQVLGEIGINNFYRGLLPLLQDSDLNVRKEALIATQRLNNIKLLPLVVENLKIPQLQKIAFEVLLDYGEQALPLLKSFYKEQPQNVIKQILRLYGRIGGKVAIDYLKTHLAQTQDLLRETCLYSLRFCSYQATTKIDKEQIEKILGEETIYGLTILRLQQETRNDNRAILLYNALNFELEKTQNRIFLLLSFIYQSEVITKIKIHFNSNNPELKAFAHELLENTFNKKHKQQLFPLLFNTIPSTKNPNVTSTIITALKMNESWLWWLKIVSIESLFKLALPNFVEIIQPFLKNQNNLVKAAAHYALQRLENPSLQLTPLPLIERIKKLHIDLFAGVADEKLAIIAPFFEELKLEPGVTLLHKDELSSSMYIILNGRVKAHDQQQTFAEYLPGMAFAELSALVPGLVTVSITTVEKTHLMCITHEQLLTLINTYPEAAKSFTGFLCNSLNTWKVRSQLSFESLNLVQEQKTYELRTSLTFMEKVFFMKTTQLFSEMPKNILLKLASFCQERFLKKGEILFNRNSYDNMIYIVVTGSIYFYDEQKIIAEAKPKETIGETRLFTQKPYMASAIANEETLLLGLDQFILSELQEQEDVAWIIINNLVHKLRQGIRCFY